MDVVTGPFDQRKTVGPASLWRAVERDTKLKRNQMCGVADVWLGVAKW